MKPKKLHIGVADFLKANRRAARLEDIEAHGKAVMFRPSVVKSKKAYDRKREKRTAIKFDDCPFSFSAWA